MKIKFAILGLIFCSEIIFAQNKIDFTAQTLENKNIKFSEILKDSPTLISFWALWCKPCRTEMKYLEDYFEKYKSKGFNIIGINQDSPRSLAKVKSFVATHKVSFPIVLDPNQEIFQKFNGQSIPLTVLFNKNGEIVYSHIGYLPGDEIKLEKEIIKLLEN
ncbi:MAG: TlpA family protein disulfide reductase [Ignavibacteriae bacterium]|nr:TlpA family protein disulfide reductase [Ignavibacteriota bacterium]